MLAYSNGEMIKPENQKVLFDGAFKSSIIDIIIKYSISWEAPNQKIDHEKIKKSLEELNLKDDLINNDADDQLNLEDDDIRL